MILAAPAWATAQVPTATLSGEARDAAARPIAAAAIEATPRDGTTARTTVTDNAGRFTLTNLPPGNYSLVARSAGLATVAREVTLRVGDEVTVVVTLHVADVRERVEVTDATPALNTRSFRVARSVGREQVDQLPLNGRGFLDLAILEPGVTLTTVANPGLGANNYQRVNLSGAFFHQARVTADGATITDRFIGGTLVNLSSEVVQEFQVATFNLDPALGVSAAGAINIVTRRGGARASGAAFSTYRADEWAAYPALRRDPRQPQPFFARRQAGGHVGGPVWGRSVFGFGSYERRNQDGVFSIANNHPIFSKLDVVHPSPLDMHLATMRIDVSRSRHQVSLRWTGDRNHTLAPSNQLGLPSNWQSLTNRAEQVQGGVTTLVGARTVNEFRYASGRLESELLPVSAAQCRDAGACIGVGAPNVLVFDAPQLRLGTQANTPFPRRQRNHHVIDTLTLDRGRHQWRVGAEWEHLFHAAAWTFNDPAQITLWGPSNLQSPALRPLYDALPASLRLPGAPPPTMEEILRLPLRSFSMGIGDPGLPGPYNFDDASNNDRVRVHVQDTWRVRPSLTLSAGVAWSLETTLFDHDLDLPDYLAPLTNGRTRAPDRDWNNVDLSLGTTWVATADGRTVLRAGAGRHHDNGSLYWKARGRAFVGPAGNGRLLVDGSLTGLNFLSTPTDFTGADLLPLLDGLRGSLTSRLGTGTDLGIRGIELIKQGDQIVDPSVRTAYAWHASAGIQRDLGWGAVLTADYVLRRYAHVGPLQNTFFVDRNRFNRPRVTAIDPDTGVVSFVRDPVIPLCTPAQAAALAPADRCSTGPISVFGDDATYLYHGVHVTLDRRLRNGLQFLAGYAYARDTGFVEFVDFDNADTGTGVNPNHRRHRLTLSAIWSPARDSAGVPLMRALASGWTFAVVSQMASRTPLNTMLTGLDLDGDGISRTLLPGTRYGEFGHALDVATLRTLVDAYNRDVEARSRVVGQADGSVTIVRPRTPLNQVITPIVLPADIASGDSLLATDVRIARDVPLGARARLTVAVEVFNVFNIANLTGYSDALNQPNYGQPSARLGQAFGSGGPRAVQVGVRLSF